MAKKTTEAVIERVYNVPLRKEYMKVPMYQRAKKAGKALKQFLQQHMKTEMVLIGPKLNEAIWKHGIRNPPHHVKVTVTKDKEGVARAELFAEAKPQSTKKKERKPAKKAEAKKE